MPDVPEYVDARLRQDRTIWLATVDGDGVPFVRPVWFRWDGDHVLLYSRPTAAKVRHISRNPHVCLHLDPNEWGENVVIVAGEARLTDEYPRADEVGGYIEKYRDGLERFGLTAEQLGDDYSVAIEVTPTHFVTY
jgi:PPOX class probable F420-dependent enzyme